MEAKADYTQDGIVDFCGQPAVSSKTGKWKACAFLVGYEAFERMAFYGVASNLVNYLTTQLHEDIVSSIPHLRPTEYKRLRLPRNRRTVNRAYGGVLSGSVVRERIIRAFLVEEKKIVKKVLKIQKAKEKQALKG
ncbi:hypothetical protein JHK82_033729 [Glycine max]|uniref:60S ribosomal protein L34 n=1 Tax=Glycine soja TaxID=3848 RepID=A0A0B2PPP7_GLYSO|nr:hypothetical protein JHK85_034447 [Glycine max]KAG4986122.1 hypothetical protein JHK86_033813 [Glycine max]KAG5119309.1 hypothetical protein JHK82_033729 [Glycine max]KAG5140301.1 hypothetical protein JHK84_034069 [Glycine max]KHN11070.1 60S ribosomal protein L34 [Glycine soja]